MKASELVGKMAIRTKPVNLGNGNKDYSYTDDKVKILKATDNHIVFEHYLFKDACARVLDERWNDDNWADYDELMNLEEK